MSNASQIPNLAKAIAESLGSGERLLDDAQSLLDFDRYPSAYSLSILSQEEFAKAFLLQLAADGSLPWGLPLQKTLRNHKCKQLAALVMDFLEREDFFTRVSRREWIGRVREIPRHVLDAIHVIVHEFLYGRDRLEWLDTDERPLDPIAKRIAEGMRDRQKQNGFYVQLAFDGSIASNPNSISKDQCSDEIERTKRIRGAIVIIDGQGPKPLSLDYDNVLSVFKLLTGAMPPDEFDARW